MAEETTTPNDLGFFEREAQQVAEAMPETPDDPADVQIEEVDA